MNRISTLLISVILAFSSSAIATTAAERSDLNLRPGVSDISLQVYDLHMLMFWICVVIGVIVFGVMFYSMVMHRKSTGAKPANFHENIKVEVIWTVIPFIILIAMAWPAATTLIAMEDTSEADVTIIVTGSQWKWHYKYQANPDVEFFSLLATQQEQIKNKFAKGENYLLEVDRPLVIPTGQKVRFLITSDDVIHSWWVPDFAIKKDANPGFINEAWTNVNEPGIYRGQCAELCGKDHGFMPIVVIAKDPAEYDAWLQEQELAAIRKEEEQRLLAMNMSMDDLMTQGKKVYDTACIACHQANGGGLPPMFPALKGSKIALEKQNIPVHIDYIINGKNTMPAFGRQLSMSEIAAVVTYERNAWGNNTGDMVQAKDVNAVINGQ